MQTLCAPVDWLEVVKTRVLFLCIGNACRSPMAEGFARAHGSDVLEAMSAGLAPAMAVVPLTHYVMLEKDIDLGDSYPKEMEDLEGAIDLIINMSGHDVPASAGTQVEKWDVLDPIGQSDEVFRRVRDEIEQRVLELIERLRSRQPAGSEALPEASQVDTRRRPTRQ
jgi:arsenate reductase